MSLFGGASKKKEKPAKEPNAFLSLEPSGKKEEEPVATPPVSDAEVGSMIETIRAKQAEIESRLAEIVSQGTVLPQGLQDLLKDLSNWPLRRQQEIVAKAHEMIDQVNDILGPGQEQVFLRKQEKKHEKRSQKAQKIRGKRNWISMQ
ncbi:hypothetical protein ELAC_0096 [Estrella lausannensis]|uniref:Uncharacterized protein n=2 Tax=Estrella lausannensis TaxID=483423 RepID=A0A0H5DPP5_9BACT|nr:hypothetical protein ELAC_0096 [Estrella lausannensis]